MKSKVIIIGSGWLGMPLAVQLAHQGYEVTSTTTSNNAKIAESTVPTVVLNTDFPHQVSTTLQEVNADIMIIAIPPSRKCNDYLSHLTLLSDAAKKTRIKRVIFISSSSVWGSNVGMVDETIPALPTTDSACAMLKFEQHLAIQGHFEATTLRLSGLFGPGRHPGRFLAGRVNVASPNSAVNMIHLTDCIGLIRALLNTPQWQSAYTGCAPSHPSRQAFYSQGAETLELPPPRFIADTGTPYKTVCGKHSAGKLSYDYVYPDLMQALKHC